MEYIVPILIVLVLVILIAFIIQKKQSTLRKQNITMSLEKELPGCIIQEGSPHVPYDYLVETESSIYLIKVVVLPVNNELIVTNENYWCKNANLKGWKRSTNPDLVDGVREFRQFSLVQTKRLIRLGIVYPGAHNITVYLNEADVEIVKVGMKAYGVYLIRYEDMAQFFRLIEQKQFTKE